MQFWGVRSGYGIRLARSLDLAALGPIELAAARLFEPYGLAELFADTTPVATLAAAVRDGRLWVAVDAQGTVVGFALAAVLDGSGHLEELDVHPDHGRRGIGRALVDAVTAWARLRRFPALTLNTMRDVPWNAPFYERLGFVALHDDELWEALQTLRRVEVERGLPGEHRVSMRLALA